MRNAHTRTWTGVTKHRTDTKYDQIQIYETLLLGGYVQGLTVKLGLVIWSFGAGVV